MRNTFDGTRVGTLAVEVAAVWAYTGFLVALPFAIVRSLGARIPDVRDLWPARTSAQRGWLRALAMGSVAWFMGAVPAGRYQASEGDWVSAVVTPGIIAAMMLVVGAVLVMIGSGTDELVHSAARRSRALEAAAPVSHRVLWVTVAIVVGGFYVGLLLLWALQHQGGVRFFSVILAAAAAVGTVFLVRRLTR